MAITHIMGRLVKKYHRQKYNGISEKRPIFLTTIISTRKVDLVLHIPVTVRGHPPVSSYFDLLHFTGEN